MFVTVSDRKDHNTRAWLPVFGGHSWPPVPGPPFSVAVLILPCLVVVLGGRAWQPWWKILYVLMHTCGAVGSGGQCRGTLGGYYHIMISFLVSGTKKSLSSKSSTSGDDMDCLMVWETAIKIFHTLVMILKKSQSRYILGSCLKYARSFLDLFLRSAMPLMDSCLRKHNQEVVTLLKSLQASTRFLQHVCTHSKV
ncbi:Fanconi anemia group D2 protein homolog isoform X1 [Panulirus ornatus]|uniref:Fanconi anemia group D2 protein homolog isoform X1 n=1 Tax=Panulirus ornatus TaxID=150431 RepID=UPI003A8A0ABA